MIKNFEKIKTAFYFLDETGMLRKETDPYFALGVLICPKPELMYKKIRSIRDRYKYYYEIKWGKMSKLKYQISKEIFDAFLSTPNTRFRGIILRKTELDFDKYFGGNFWKVFSSFTIALLKLNLGASKPPYAGREEDIICVIADNYFTPKKIDLESRIRNIVNDHYKDLRVMGFCQMDSKSCDLLQIADIFLGAALYDLKVFEKVIPKKINYKMRFVRYLHRKFKVKTSFFKKGRNFIRGKFKITIFDPTRSKAQLKSKTGQGPQRSSPVI